MRAEAIRGAKRVGIFLCVVCFNFGAFALPQHSPVPGGVAVIQIPMETKKAFYLKRQAMILEESNRKFVVIGIPLSANSGSHTFTLLNNDKQKSDSNFEVFPKEYKEQHLTIKDKRKVNPEKRDMDRIGRDWAEMNQAFTHFDTHLETQTAFSLPVEGPISSPFGLKRFLNNQKRNPHSGLDIAAASGVAIKATASGKVVAKGDYFFNGNTILLDHGQGLISMYCHMSKINVAMGEKLEAGDLIGEVGMTGRVTGPHLHWSVSLNNARVDPNLFLLATPTHYGATQ